MNIIYLPPYSPELNSTEQVWDFMRSNYPSNRVYENIEDIFDACCEAWNMFVNQPEVIFSIGMRSWMDLDKIFAV